MAVKVIERRGKSGWWVLANHGGKRKAKRFENKKAATAFAKQIEEAFAAGSWQLPGAEEASKDPALTFSEYAARYVEAAEHQLKFSTWNDYRNTIRVHLLPVFAERPLGEITRRDVKDFETTLAGNGHSTHVRAKALRVLSTVLSEAVEDEHIPANPVLARKKRRGGANRHAKKRINPLTREELTHLLDTCQNHSEEQNGRTVYPFRTFYPFFLTLARTGMRLGEAIALKWGDVDFHGSFIEVQRAYVQDRLTTPKNGKARRVLMSPQLIETLRGLKHDRFPEVEADRSAKVVQLGARREAEAVADALVFPNGAGGFIDESNLRRRVWAPLLEAAELRHVRIHDLRHTYASLMMEAGKEIHFIQEQLGHHSPAFTLSVYGHLLPRDRRGEVACLDDDTPKEVARGLQKAVHFSPSESIPVLENTRVLASGAF